MSNILISNSPTDISHCTLFCNLLKFITEPGVFITGVYGIWICGQSKSLKYMQLLKYVWLFLIKTKKFTKLHKLFKSLNMKKHKRYTLTH